ncbi:hypothetical protein R3P38DRAFT_3267870 [Favolaschia claudopus]|uniref:Uncharacterized protein n=1 Tax=Favolaschia claudopus TaxID=2862362 RepID=A0AAW0BPA5_9AGAR
MQNSEATYDLLRNRPPSISDPENSADLEQQGHPVPLPQLRACDGLVGAIVQAAGESFFITTNVDFIPVLPTISGTHELLLYANMRYGVDDPIQWPQQYTAKFPHLVAISREGARPELNAMHWGPKETDFVVGSAITRGIGKLVWTKVSPVCELANALISRCREHQASATPETRSHFARLAPQLIQGLARLQEFPGPFDKLRFVLACVQRTYLELDAVLEYATVYKPRMESLTPTDPTIPVANCVGVFTSSVEVAQQLWGARLPYWLVRPTYVFSEEVILKVVTPEKPPWFMDVLDPSHDDPPVIYTGNGTDAKLAAIQREAAKVAWYRDPFDRPVDQITPLDEVGPSSAGPAISPTVHANRGHRFHPYSKSGGRAVAPQAGSTGGRNKFEALLAAEMPDIIPSWADALRKVDLSRPTRSKRTTDTHYILPEPALLAAPESLERRRMFLHHWLLLRDAFHYMLSSSEPCTLLKAQEWRDILEGLLEQRGNPKSRTGRRSAELSKLLAPLFKACGIAKLEGFPVPRSSIPEYSVEKAKEVLWGLAETNFRFELSSLDARASGRDRWEEVRMCFAGGMFVSVPLNLSQRGLASTDIHERHRYFLRLARLMMSWHTDTVMPRAVADAANAPSNTEWSSTRMGELEHAVATYYTQCFYELFGRAAVVPMRLSHQLPAHA